MLVTGNFQEFYGTAALPWLREITDRGYRSRKPMFPSVMDVQSSSKPHEQFQGVSGVSRLQLIPSGDAVRRDVPVKGFNKTFTHARYGLAIPTTLDMVEDDKWRLIATSHMDLGWSTAETREIQAAAIYNEAFTTNGPDGVPLCSASHPLYKVGGLQSNLMTAADLDMYPLQLALTAFETQRRPSGEFIHVPPVKLVIHPSRRFIAHKLLMSGDDPSTAERSTNPLKGAEDGMLKPFPYIYLTSETAWFLIAQPSQTGLVWFNRKMPYKRDWEDHDSEVSVLAQRYKSSVGFHNYIGVVGNAGQ